MDRIKKITHKGKEIVYIDFSKLSSLREVDTIMNVIQNVGPVVSSYPPKSALTLTNVDGLFFSREIINAFKDSQAQIKAFQKKAAVIGIHGLQKIALDAITALAGEHDTKIFKTEAEALDWLVE
jgi:hypothetical protein